MMPAGTCAVHGPTQDRNQVPPQGGDASRRRGLVLRRAFVGLGVAALLVSILASLLTRSELGRLRAAAAESGSLVRSLRDASNSANGRLAALERSAKDSLDPAEVAKRVRPAVFTVVTSDGTGSAFVVRTGSKSVLLTAYHVVRGTWLRGGAREVRLSNADGSYGGVVIRVSVASDAAVIEVPASLPSVDLTEAIPSAGSPVMVIASQGGLTGSVSTGIASGLRDGYLQFSAEAGPGSSGGPLLDKKGLAAGLISFKFVAEGIEGLSFAVPMRDICLALPVC